MNNSPSGKNNTTKYLKQVLIGNCATQIWFGRASLEEMQTFNRLAGSRQDVKMSTSTRETALSDENAQMAMTTSYTVEESDRYSGTDVRYRQFLECSVMTVRDSTPLPPFIGKVSFLEERKTLPVDRYVVKWSKYYQEPTEGTENIVPVVTASTEVKDTIEMEKIQKRKKGLLSAGSTEAVTRVINDKEDEKEFVTDNGNGQKITENAEKEGEKELKPKKQKEVKRKEEEEVFFFDMESWGDK